MGDTIHEDIARLKAKIYGEDNMWQALFSFMCDTHITFMVLNDVRTMINPREVET